MPIRTVCAVSLLLLGGCMKAPDAAGWSSGPAERVLTVIGTGRFTAAPARLDVDALVVSESPAPEVAWQQGADRVYKLTRALETVGVKTADMNAVAAELHPTGTAYRLEQRLRITVRDLQHVPPVLAAALGNGASRIDGVHFGLDDARAAGDRARERALLDAGDKAQELAQELQLRLGAVRSVEELAADAPPSAGTPQDPPAALETSSVLRVTYALLD